MNSNSLLGRRPRDGQDCSRAVAPQWSTSIRSARNHLENIRSLVPQWEQREVRDDDELELDALPEEIEAVVRHKDGTKDHATYVRADRARPEGAVRVRVEGGGQVATIHEETEDGRCRNIEPGVGWFIPVTEGSETP